MCTRLINKRSVHITPVVLGVTVTVIPIGGIEMVSLRRPVRQTGGLQPGRSLRLTTQMVGSLDKIDGLLPSCRGLVP